MRVHYQHKLEKPSDLLYIEQNRPALKRIENALKPILSSRYICI